LVQKDDLLAKRKPLIDKTMAKDADDINKALNRSGQFNVDKMGLINILCTRTKWQIKLISDVLQKKYKVNLLEQVVNELTTTWGKISSGALSGLCKLFVYRILPQHERDAALLRDSSDGISLDDDGLIEIITTRTNKELKLAMEYYKKEYKKDLFDIVKSKAGFKNFRDFMLKLLECNRDEKNRPFDDDTSKMYAEELYNAITSKKFGVDAEPIIRILSTVNKAQFDSINDFYPDNNLKKDIQSKLGGSFSLAVLTMCTDKYEYLATKLEQAFKSYSPDKETICRILGCLSRWECVKVRDAYDRADNGRSLKEAIKTVIKQQNYQSACLLLVEDDQTLTPLGSDREESEDELEAIKDGERSSQMAEIGYHPNRFREKGQIYMNQDTYDFTIDHEVFMDFEWNGGKFLDIHGLRQGLADITACIRAALHYKECLDDDINAAKALYYSVVANFSETETWIRNLNSHIRYLTQFIKRRNELTAISATSKSPAK